jgi:DNA mismatch endonuclease (patch repair protein)
MDRSENMRRIKSRDTGPEMLVRRVAHGMGYRYRLHNSDVPGKPDMVFFARRKVIFVHGCFWHAHGCKRSHTPRSNTNYWNPKLRRNHARDVLHAAQLRSLGWKTLVIWECTVGNLAKLQARLARFLE